MVTHLFGPQWVDSGRIFTNQDGSHPHPGKVTDYFQRLVANSGLPPVRLHDPRRGAATLARAAGVEMADISAMLGHSNVSAG